MSSQDRPAALGRKPLDREGCRIIIAIQEDRFHENKHGRYVIDGEERPDRKTREALRKRGLIDSRFDGKRFVWFVTEKGAAMLKRDLHGVVEALRDA